MEKEMMAFIEAAHSIVVSRHKSPDLDAYGAQFGLYYALKAHFPTKKIYAIGDTNQLNQFQELDRVNQSILSESLLFVLDTSVQQMLGDDSFKDAKQIIIIDHHQNDPDIPYDLYYHDTEASSTSEMIARLLENNHIEIDQKAAKPLYMGIVGDTGRFLYTNVKPDTFRIAAKLLETGIDLAAIYNSMYVESLHMKQVKAEYMATILLTKHNVGYRKNDEAFQKKYHLDSYTISRSLANQLAGIKEIPIWANFTYEVVSKRILCELRSREIPIVEIAKKYGGGGHLLACGCTVDSWDITDQILQDLDQLLEAHHG